MTPNHVYPLDLNEDQNQFFYTLKSQPSSSSSSCPPFINPNQEQGSLFHSESQQYFQIEQKAENFGSYGGSNDYSTLKNKSRLKLSIWKKSDQNGNENTSLKSSKTMDRVVGHESCNKFDQNQDQSGSNTIRVCADCNTTKTPLWRSGPRGPKSLCNACGIRQRKARRAMAAAASGVTIEESSSIKVQKKIKKSKSSDPQIKKKNKIKSNDHELANFDKLRLILSESSAYQQVFPQDEKEAAILLMALSYGLVHG